MPLFYFNLYNDEVALDDEGVELGDAAAAHAFAVKAVRGLAAESVSKGHFVGAHRIEIQDQHHRPIGTVRYDEAVEIRE